MMGLRAGTATPAAAPAARTQLTASHAPMENIYTMANVLTPALFSCRTANAPRTALPSFTWPPRLASPAKINAKPARRALPAILALMASWHIEDNA